MIFKKLFSYSDRTKAAHGLYSSLVEQARQPVFYVDFDVPDTLDGRFDMIVLHAALVLRRLKQDAEKTRDLSQALFDYMFDDFDQNLRELGIGDMGVGTRVKKMAKAFYGRLAAYDEGLSMDDDASLIAAIERNLFHASEPSVDQLSRLAIYTRQAWSDLEGQDIERILAGHIDFGSPPTLNDGEMDGVGKS